LNAGERVSPKYYKPVSEGGYIENVKLGGDNITGRGNASRAGIEAYLNAAVKTSLKRIPQYAIPLQSGHENLHGP
jgi:hypothetical protein